MVNDVDGSTVTLTGTVTVTDQTLTGALSYPVAAVENISTGTVLLATFNDPNPLDTASGVSATVNWGDGTGSFPAFVTLVGTSSTSGSMFEVTGNHIYTTPGSYTVSITATTLGERDDDPVAAHHHGHRRRRHDHRVGYVDLGHRGE